MKNKNRKELGKRSGYRVFKKKSWRGNSAELLHAISDKGLERIIQFAISSRVVVTCVRLYVIDVGEVVIWSSLAMELVPFVLKWFRDKRSHRVLRGYMSLLIFGEP